MRDYPDITHTVRSQYPVPWWDPAFNFTLGREPINPRPVFYAAVHDRTAPYTDGFISYSDGVNDDLNKAVWTRLAWAPGTDVREIVREYTRFFFGARAADRAADGLFALEKNWEGPLATNGGVDGTLALWQSLEREAPSLAGDWRWQMYLLRAYFDAYTRHRLLYETALEREANRALESAPARGAAAAIDAAIAVLRTGHDGDCCSEWRRRIQDLCESLFRSIRLQTSVPKYQGVGGRTRRRARLHRLSRSTTAGGSRTSSPRCRPCPANRRSWRGSSGCVPGRTPAPAASTTTWDMSGDRPRVVRAEVTSDGALRARGSDAGVSLGAGREEPQAAVLAIEPALARGDRLRAPQSCRARTRCG